MKKKNTNKIVYGILSACAVFIFCLAISKNVNYPSNITNNEELAMDDNIVQEENNTIEDNIVFNDGSLQSMAEIDAKWEDENLEGVIDFINKIDVPDGLYLSRQGKVFVKEDINSEDYSKLRQYALFYSNGSTKNLSQIEIIFTKEQTILGCLLPDKETMKSSTINGTEVKLFKSENLQDESKIVGDAYFEKDGYTFYINVYNIYEEEFIKVLKSILD